MVVDSLEVSRLNWDVVWRVVHCAGSHPAIVMAECSFLGRIVSRSAFIRELVPFSNCGVLFRQIAMFE